MRSEFENSSLLLFDAMSLGFLHPGFSKDRSAFNCDLLYS